MYCTNEKVLKNLNYLRHSTDVLRPQKKEIQQRKPIIDGTTNKKIKGRKRSSEYPNTKIWRENVNQGKSVVSSQY